LPAAELMPYAMDIAREIASKSPIAVRLAKEAARLTLTMPPRDAYRYEQGNTVALSKTEDTKEAQKAFFEKRKPVFTGR
jgi:enoyl-CoA hydratase